MFQYLEWVAWFEDTPCYSDYTRSVPDLCWVLLFVEPLWDEIMDVLGGIWRAGVWCEHPNSPMVINRHMEFRSKQMLSAGNKILKYYRTVVVKKTEGLFESGGKDAKCSPHYVNLPLLSNNPKVFFGSWGAWGFITLSVYFEEDWFQALWRRFLFCFSFGYFIWHVLKALT